MAARVAGEQVRLTILEASRRSGLSEPTLRYYEQIGLIGPVPRDPSSGHRRYDAAAAEQRELFDHHAGRLEAEIERLTLRLEYLRLKARLWDARDRGDTAAAQGLIPRLVGLIERF